MNKNFYLTLCLLLSVVGWSWAQVPPPPPPPPEPEPEIFIVVERKAQPKRGYKEFYRYISRQLRYRYPSEAYRKRVQGVVLVEFMVEKDGSFSSFKIIKSVGYGCDKEAIRVLKRAPRWYPAKQRGIPIRCKCQIPIRFELL